MNGDRNGFSIVIIPIVLIAFIILGISGYFILNKNSDDNLYIVEESEVDKKSEVDPYDPSSPLVEFIQGRSWSSYLGGGPFAEGTEWTFRKNGTFDAHVISDYIEEWNGNWKLIDFNNGKGWLYITYSDKIYKNNTTSTKDFHSLTFVEAENKHLTMDFHYHFWGKETENEQSSSNNITTIKEVIKDFPEAGLLTGEKWIKSTEENKNFIPHELTFNSDGTFYANYIREDDCDFKGNWGVKSSDLGTISLRMDAPDSNCDLRGYKGWGMGSGNLFTLTDNKLISEHFSYHNYHRE